MTDYYRFEQSRVLNLISPSNCNVVYDKTEKLAVASGSEAVRLWNIRTGALVHRRMLLSSDTKFLLASNLERS